MRVAGTVGWSNYYLSENDKGPDDAVHDWIGVFSIYDPEGTVGRGDLGTINIEKVRERLLEVMFE